MKRSEMTCERCNYYYRGGGGKCRRESPCETPPMTRSVGWCGQGLWPNPKWTPDSTYRKRYLVWGAWEDEE
jgi:hypothetical protein